MSFYKHVQNMSLDEAMRTYGEVSAEIGEVVAYLDQLKSRIKELVLEKEETVEKYGVKAIYRPPYTRHTIDKKELERLSTKFPEVQQVFVDKPVRGSVQIK